MAIDQVRVRITGMQPLIMHSNRGVNPRLPEVQENKAIAKKGTRKTEEDLDRMARIEWELGLYYDPKIGPYLPSHVILAALRDGAKKTKQGKLIVEAVLMEELMVKLEYSGPRDLNGLYDDGRFFDLRPVRVQQATVNRARPIFPSWAAEFTLTYDSESLDENDLLRIIETAGRRVGLGDYRPTYGRFTMQVIAGARNGRKEAVA